jgi:hypothetical protein
MHDGTLNELNSAEINFPRSAFVSRYPIKRVGGVTIANDRSKEGVLCSQMDMTSSASEAAMRCLGSLFEHDWLALQGPDSGTLDWPRIFPKPDLSPKTIPSSIIS